MDGARQAKRRNIMRRIYAPALAATLAGGCATQTTLEPAPAANEAGALEDAATAQTAGVEMVVQANAWPGNPAITAEVTPLRVRIENNSGNPLRISYSEFALVASDGSIYRALPPFRIEGMVASTPSGPYAPIARPGFGFRGFTVADTYSPIYPGISPVASPFLADPFYYERYYGYWERTELPTQEMLERAIPEGELAPGGDIAGFFYFQKVPEDEQLRLRYRAELVNARNGATFAELSIPFIANPEA
jgi:hypothetical protein